MLSNSFSYYHPKDYIQALYKAYQKEENPAAKDAMAQILVNSRMCAEGHRPICQDTGIATVFLKVGMDVQWDAEMSVQEMVNEAYAVHTPILTTTARLRIGRPGWQTSKYQRQHACRCTYGNRKRRQSRSHLRSQRRRF